VTPAGNPEAPTSVNAVSGNASVTGSFVAPTVTGGPDIVSYTVTSSPTGGTCLANVSAKTFTCTGLTNGTAYTFAVTAFNGIFNSVASTSSSSVIPATVPDPPTSIAASSTTSGSATISFTAPVNNGGSAITGYTIVSTPTGAVCTIDPNTTSFVCTGLVDGTSYTYAVRATNAIGNSTSAISNALITQGAATAPASISATTGDTKATITFSGAVSNGSTITSYTVQAYDSTGTALTGLTCTVTTSATGGTCEVTGLTNGSSYTFRVVTNSIANNAADSSAVSIPTTPIVPAKAPEAPSGLEVIAGTGKITVRWEEPASNGSTILSYTVQAYDAAGNPVAGATCTATAPALTCDVSSNLLPSINYTFKATATSAAGTSVASSASPSAAINAAPSAPINVTALAANASATVSWDAPININGSAITGYTVTAYSPENNVAGSCTSTASTQSCVVNNLTNGVAYTFKVTATNGIGTSVQSSASLPATPSTVPNAPTINAVASGNENVVITFTVPANNGGSAITGYTVTSNDGRTISTTSSPVTFSGLTNGVPYTFTIKARNANGDSVASVASASSTPALTSPPLVVRQGQPTGTPYVGSILTSDIQFSGSPTPAISYQWKACIDPQDAGTCSNISGATSPTFALTANEVGKYLVVTATAQNSVGTVSETSSPSPVIKPEIVLTTPSGTQSATVGTAYTLSISAAGGGGSFAYTITSGSLPAGLSLDPATGQISGTPTVAGSYTFTIRATDANGAYRDIVVNLTVNPAAVVVVPTPPTCDATCQAEAAAAEAARIAAQLKQHALLHLPKQHVLPPQLKQHALLHLPKQHVLKQNVLQMLHVLKRHVLQKLNVLQKFNVLQQKKQSLMPQQLRQAKKLLPKHKQQQLQLKQRSRKQLPQLSHKQQRMQQQRWPLIKQKLQ
jgi:hypothetical protein